MNREHSLFLIFFFSLDRKETKGQDRTIPPLLSPFFRKPKERELKGFSFSFSLMKKKQKIKAGRLPRAFAICRNI
jgi:hypothetical protein